jgi:4-hydroxy-tetrahydrodipicolinate reductase
MKKIKIGVLGANGRMGQELALLMSEQRLKYHSIGIVRSGDATSYDETGTKEEKTFKKTDLLIDFSNPETCIQGATLANKFRRPFISGTTGLSKEDKQVLVSLAKTSPILWSPNMSLGIAVIKKAMAALAFIKDFDFQIEEFHHNKKKDRPSGTALMLQTHLEKTVGKILPPPLVMRAGAIIGVHKIHAVSNEEMISIEHQALNRKVFAQGALTAGEWLLKQKAGFYSMEDLF